MSQTPPPLARLSSQTIDRAADSVARPSYDRRLLSPGIVHLGVGAFHRGHQAVYLDDLLRRDVDAAAAWAVLGASLRSPRSQDALRPQDGLYTLVQNGPDGAVRRLIGAVLDVLTLSLERERLLDALAAPHTKIVTLTITEKGYLRDPQTGRLDADHPDLRADLERPDQPSTAPGLLIEALARRRRAGVAPFAVVSCDNLPNNGQTTRGVLCALAALRGDRLADWVESDVPFPTTMVDRIVPATTDADRAANDAALGLTDAAPVMAEPFKQWVVEDVFPEGRPALESVGVEMTRDVAPFERMKLRMLNGPHSTLAYLGYLAGRETVAEAMADPSLRPLVEGLMRHEAAPTVDRPADALSAYADALLERFDNTALRHRTWQIAMDGTQKLPQRLLETVRERLAAERPWPRLALGIAAWMRYASGVDESGAAIDVRDPMADTLRRLAAGAPPQAICDRFLDLDAVFGELGRDPRFRAGVSEAIERLYRLGARDAAAQTEQLAADAAL